MRIVSPNKTIRICADDYAQNASIDEGILTLCDAKRINAVSCIVTSPDWPISQQALKPFAPSVFMGQHLNFTDGIPLSESWSRQYGPQFLGHSWLVKMAYTRQLSKDVIKAEIKAQVDAFQESWGLLPDFIDGHLHVHQLLGIRQAMIEVYTQHHWDCAIRNTSNGIVDLLSFKGFPKCQLIALLGGISLKKSLCQRQIKTNTSFAGIRRYNHLHHVRFDFNRFLSESKHGGLIMCHPGMSTNDLSDPLTQHRCHELNYLMSTQFIEDLQFHGFQLEVKMI